MSPGDCPMEPVYAASFTISGRIVHPTADDYEAEAMLLRQEGAAMHRQRRPGWWRLYEQARVYARLARRKRFAEQQAQQARQRKAREAA